MDENQRKNVLAKKQRPAGGTEDEESEQSLGERLIPLLVTAMECCLIYTLLLVITGTIPGSGSAPLLPFWAIFLVFFGLYGLAAGLDWFAGKYLGGLRTGPYRALVGLVLTSGAIVSLVFCVWLRFYASAFSFFNPAWLQAFSGDIGLFDRDMVLLVLGFFFCMLAWLSYQTVAGKTNAALLLSKGTPLMAILTAISLGEGLVKSNADFWQAALLLPIFYWLGLAAQALQKVSAKRRSHIFNLEESPRRQERIIFQIMALLGIVIIVAGLGMVFIHGGVSIGIPRISQPELLPVNSSTPVVSKLVKPPTPRPLYPHTFPLPVLFLLICMALLLVLLGIVVYLFVRAWPKHRRKRRKKAERDERKSLWSWALFWSQCKSLVLAFMALLRHLLGKSRDNRDEQMGDLWQAPLEIRSVRELYQAFLQKATRQGYPRQQDETPYEFRSRLNEGETLLEPELGAITDAYALARYGGYPPPADEIARVKAAWQVLNNRWPEAE